MIIDELPEEIVYVKQMVEKHAAWRRQSLNLIASENALSPAVRRALDNDWLGRYADYTGRDLNARRYRGVRYITEIEKTVEVMAKRIFQADYVELRPIGGHLAGVGVLMGLCRPGDVVLELGSSSGGHREATKTCIPKLIDLDVRFLPFNGERYNIDIPATAKLIEETRPRLVILGSSNFLFPHPVREIKKILEGTHPHGLLIFDASHVLGLLAGRGFQDPLAEGADVVYSSTHKTFPGPQGGIIFTNRGDLIEVISQAIYPALVTNHHAFRMPALAIALAEMEVFGERYTHQICANAQALGAALEAAGIPCVRVDGIYSRSHTVLARVAQFGTSPEIALRLEEADIICTGTSLPEAQGSEGIRLGVQELTHHGANEADMLTVAELIADVVLVRRLTKEVTKDVHAFTGRLRTVRFTW
jgi:glycine hydroxymethyltransferase